MDQSRKKAEKVDQFLYQDRWVNKAHFRAFVYDKKGDQKLANSYDEFEALTTSGIWFGSKPEASLVKDQRKQKDVALPND